eukprot:CAMPEP_0197079648 /NCGR_PEP_ID=MMETSP1384-20130603/213734_1 /TAXON_ID=29189 /ORGANISM="Ammonia sp." /LENGTH=139 /DNA_ID=CAMNT_0042518525 /DNA_START=363 /DNA_END=782 /DNA_ORIENTATION=+
MKRVMVRTEHDEYSQQQEGARRDKREQRSLGHHINKRLIAVRMTINLDELANEHHVQHDRHHDHHQTRHRHKQRNLDELGNEHHVQRDRHHDHHQTRHRHKQRACGAHCTVIGVRDRADEAKKNGDGIEDAADNECATG